MKKLIALLLILAMVPAAALADLDWSRFNDAELEYIRKSICAEILARSEQKSVTVQPGFYVIGEDIPAGHWTIKYGAEDSCSVIIYFTKANETGRAPDLLGGDFYQVNIGGPKNILPDLYNQSETDLELKSGYFLSIDYGPVVFEPFTGRKTPFI